jgi:'Cold-shock' DNA-binding domain
VHTREGNKAGTGTVKWFNRSPGFGFIRADDPPRTRSELHNKGEADMSSSGKKKTTMAKLTRESKLRERRLDKQAKKDARKHPPAYQPEQPSDTLNATTGEAARPGG